MHNSNKRSDWFIFPAPRSNAAFRLFCFPYAGGNASTYIPLAEQLPPNIELVAVQPPGRANRVFETAYTRMMPLIANLYEEFKSLDDKPFFFYGHSLGSRIAFQLTIELFNNHQRLPSHFFASGSRSPDRRTVRKHITELNDQEFIQILKSLNGTSQELLDNKEFMKFYLPLLRADFELADSYCFQDQVELPVALTVISGKEDHAIKPEEVKTWANFFSSTIAFYEVEGDHFFIDTNKKDVMKIIDSSLANYLRANDLTKALA